MDISNLKWNKGDIMPAVSKNIYIFWTTLGSSLSALLELVAQWPHIVTQKVREIQRRGKASNESQWVHWNVLIPMYFRHVYCSLQYLSQYRLSNVNLTNEKPYFWKCVISRVTKNFYPRNVQKNSERFLNYHRLYCLRYDFFLEIPPNRKEYIQ